VELSGERQELWDAPTTTVQDKKELVRTIRTFTLTLAADGLRPREIAERLNQLGLKKLQGNIWSAETVAKKLSEEKRRRAFKREQPAW